MAENSRHQCMIYEGLPSVHLPRLVPTLLKKLDENHRCLFLGSNSMIALMRNELAAVGLEVSAHVKKGSLIFSSERNHLKDGRFDPDAMLAGITEAVGKALNDGYAGFWATGDMTWEFGVEQNLSKLLEYECGLEKLFRTLPHLSGICQYHKDTLPLDMIGNALYTHRAVYINHTLQRINPFYLQPEALIRQSPKLVPEEIERMFRTATDQN